MFPPVPSDGITKHGWTWRSWWWPWEWGHRRVRKVWGSHSGHYLPGEAEWRGWCRDHCQDLCWVFIYGRWVLDVMLLTYLLIYCTHFFYYHLGRVLVVWLSFFYCFLSDLTEQSMLSYIWKTYTLLVILMIIFDRIRIRLC